MLMTQQERTAMKMRNKLAGVNEAGLVAYDPTHRQEELSVKPYFQYGIGLQKKCGERFSGFGQAMLRNGGRTGVALSAGFRWALGKDVKNPNFNKASNSVPELPKTKMNLRSVNK